MHEEFFSKAYVQSSKLLPVSDITRFSIINNFKAYTSRFWIEIKSLGKFYTP